MPPNYAFLLFIGGILCMYGEFVRPGRVVFAAVGGICAIGGGYFLWKSSPGGLGMTLVAVAAALFVSEAFWVVNLVSAVAGTIALTCGFCLLFPAPPRIFLGLAIPVCVGFGIVTGFLAQAAKRARRNKWSDLQDRRFG